MNYPFTLYDGPTFRVVEVSRGVYSRIFNKTGKVEKAVGFEDGSSIVKWSETKPPVRFDKSSDYILIPQSEPECDVILTRAGSVYGDYSKIHKDRVEMECLLDGQAEWRIVRNK